MRRALAGCLLVALMAAAAAHAVPAPAAALKVVRLAPLTVRGTHFKPHERVKLTLTTDSKRTVRRVVATPTGTLTAVWTATLIDRCSAYALVARGAGGSTVTLTVRPLCPPA
jgi:hypothetical protein